MTIQSRDWHPASLRLLYRRAKQALLASAKQRWPGTSATLRRAVNHAMKRWRGNPNALLRILRDASLTAMLASSIVLTAKPVWSGPPIELSSVAAGSGGFAINGESPIDRSGRRVSNVGDVNGDGLDDVVVASSLADPHGQRSGRTYVVFGKKDSTPVELSSITAGIGGFVLNGERPEDYSGLDLSGAGDVNGDGLDDILVAAPSADLNGLGDSGRSYVVFGKANTTPVELSDVAAGIGGFSIDGAYSFDNCGQSLSGAGDVNGDGFADIFVKAITGTRSYVIFGGAAPSSLNLSSIAMGIGEFVINGDPASPHISCVSSAGDVNGDGLADLALSDRFASPNGDRSGRSYIVFGKDDTLAVDLTNIAKGVGGFVINGESATDESGIVVSDAGDVNGDGLGDFIIDSDRIIIEPLPRKAYVVFGKADTAPVELTQIASGVGGFAIVGEEGNTLRGRCVSGAGDVNGDGLGDLLVSYWRSGPNGFESGESCVIFGRTVTTPIQVSDIKAGVGGFVINGEQANDNSGYCVSGPGDVNGDGISDIIIGAPGSYVNGNGSGRSYLVFAPPVATSSATYLGRSRAGDGPGGHIVPPTRFPDARVKIQFSDDDTASVSTETAEILRSNASISGFDPQLNVANVAWHLTTTRTGWNSAEVTLKYTDAEVSGLAEGNLKIFKAESLSGPWVEQATTLDTARKDAKTTVTGFSFFTLAAAGPVPVELSQFSIE